MSNPTWGPAGDGEDGGDSEAPPFFDFFGVGMYGEFSEMDGEGINTPSAVNTCRSR